MSIVFEVSQQAVLLIPMAGGTGILDLLSGKNAAVQTFLRGLSITLGIIFIIWQGVTSRGALARIIVAGLAAALFIWIVFNVTALQTRVDNEVNSDGPPNTQLVQVYRGATQPI